jgi:hypothetical protein
VGAGKKRLGLIYGKDIQNLNATYLEAKVGLLDVKPSPQTIIVGDGASSTVKNSEGELTNVFLKT